MGLQRSSTWRQAGSCLCTELIARACRSDRRCRNPIMEQVSSRRVCGIRSMASTCSTTPTICVLGCRRCALGNSAAGGVKDSRGNRAAYPCWPVGDGTGLNPGTARQAVSPRHPRQQFAKVSDRKHEICRDAKRQRAHSGARNSRVEGRGRVCVVRPRSPRHDADRSTDGVEIRRLNHDLFQNDKRPADFSIELQLPPGTDLTIHRRFPHVRYFNFAL